MKEIIKNIYITLILYIFDIIICGSLMGIIFVIGHFLSNCFGDTNFILWKSYLQGVLLYWIVDSFLSKFREVYREYREL